MSFPSIAQMHLNSGYVYCCCRASVVLAALCRCSDYLLGPAYVLEYFANQALPCMWSFTKVDYPKVSLVSAGKE